VCSAGPVTGLFVLQHTGQVQACNLKQAKKQKSKQTIKQTNKQVTGKYLRDIQFQLT
jgi:hypothetical protein